MKYFKKPLVLPFASGSSEIHQIASVSALNHGPKFLNPISIGVHTCSFAWAQGLVWVATVLAVLDSAMDALNHMVESGTASYLRYEVVL